MRIFAEPRLRGGALPRPASMSRRPRSASPTRSARPALAAVATLAALWLAGTAVAAPNYPTRRRRSVETAKKAAEVGVPLSEILPTAPDVYTVKRRDTLWDISKMYLQQPLALARALGPGTSTSVRNPHLIFPGQVLFPRQVQLAAPGCAWASSSAPLAMPGSSRMCARATSRSRASPRSRST